MKCLNLGCGGRFHPEWDNLDFFSHAPEVRAHDLRKGIPYPDQTFDVVYHSHLLEHFSKEQALIFLKECHRVLKTGGVIRVAVPDLEAIARLYLEALQKASQGSSRWAENYDWMMLEMYDQAVREHSGGSCNEYFSQNPIPNWDFVHERVGAEADAALAFVRAEVR
jgi:predicted SAM-dependent methyltransferase